MAGNPTVASNAMQSPTLTADPTPARVNPQAGEPEWWLKYLVNQLMARRGEYRLREDYFNGDHMRVKGDQRYMRALGHLRDLAATNYIGMVTSTPVERMQVRGFRFGEPGSTDDDAAAIWNENDMDLQAHSIHMNAAKYGLAYALVTPAARGEKYPTITSEDPRTCIVYRDPKRPTKALAGLRMWEDEVRGRILAVLYLPEGSYGFVGPYVYETDGWSVQDLRQRLVEQTPSAAGFMRSGFVPNPEETQEVPLVEYVWRPDTGAIPQAECGKDVRTVQDRINQTVFQRLCISHFQAYKQRWASGLTIPKRNKHGQIKGSTKAPFNPGFDQLWVSENEAAKFGEFSSADITQILEAVTDDVGAIATLTKTPAHYLMGKMANISGETLTQAESGLASKTWLRMSSMGWSHERVMKLCFAFMGDERAKDPTATVLWANPGRDLIVDTAQAGLQWSQIGIPLELIMEAQGIWDPDQIAFAKAEKEKADQLALQQQQEQMQSQQDHQLALAKVSAAAKGPGAQASATKPGATSTKPANPAVAKAQGSANAQKKPTTKAAKPKPTK